MDYRKQKGGGAQHTPNGVAGFLDHVSSLIDQLSRAVAVFVSGIGVIYFAPRMTFVSGFPVVAELVGYILFYVGMFLAVCYCAAWTVNIAKGRWLVFVTYVPLLLTVLTAVIAAGFTAIAGLPKTAAPHTQHSAPHAAKQIHSQPTAASKTSPREEKALPSSPKLEQPSRPSGPAPRKDHVSQ